jgi:hypothetical protein
MKRAPAQTSIVSHAARTAAFDRRPAVNIARRVSRAGALPILFVGALAALSATTIVDEHESLWWSIWSAAAVLGVWDAALLTRTAAIGRSLRLEVVLRKQHYLQACVQGSIFLYWGWYWREVYHSAPLLLAQLLFAYAFDMLLVWSRRDDYTLGFGPFPVVFSINLFLWFRPEWFYFQFVLLAVGFMAKEFLRWTKDGRSAHIFNPSSFPLGVFALILLVTGSTGMTWGQEIATTQFYPPHMYAFIFLCGLTGQYLFGVATMTLAAAATLYGFGLVYFWSTGVYYFFDTYIQIAVFIGIHLLVTDPATAPRTELGRLIFGVIYGIGVIAIYGLLGNLHAPTFYDKLLAVPIMNLMVRAIDRAVRSPAFRRLDPANLGRTLAPRRRNLAYVGLWAALFVAMSSAHAIGDTVPGHWVPFWQRACHDQRAYACSNLLLIESSYCDAGATWACNEAGILLGKARRMPQARQMFLDGCGGGLQTACDNGRQLDRGNSAFTSVDPQPADYQILLREGKGPLPPLPDRELYARACAQGWATGCAAVNATPSR